MVKTRMSNMKREKRNMILFMTILLIGLVVFCIPFTAAPITKVDEMRLETAIDMASRINREYVYKECIN